MDIDVDTPLLASSGSDTEPIIDVDLIPDKPVVEEKPPEKPEKPKRVLPGWMTNPVPDVLINYFKNHFSIRIQKIHQILLLKFLQDNN